MGTLEGRLRAALRDAMRARDAVATSALRSALGALANAGAVPAGDLPLGDGPFAGSTAGLGAAEVPRRELTAADEAAVLAAEVASRREAAAAYPPDAAARLHAEADLLAGFLP